MGGGDVASGEQLQAGEGGGGRRGPGAICLRWKTWEKIERRCNIAERQLVWWERGWRGKKKVIQGRKVWLGRMRMRRKRGEV